MMIYIYWMTLANVVFMHQGGRLNMVRNEKQRKKLAELEAQLVLASPNLPFRISKRAGSVHTFLISSEYERDQWSEAIQVLQVNKNKNKNMQFYKCFKV